MTNSVGQVNLTTESIALTARQKSASRFGRNSLMATASKIQIYDTTLRDGCQSEDVSLTLEDKLEIARRIRRMTERESPVAVEG